MPVFAISMAVVWELASFLAHTSPASACARYAPSVVADGSDLLELLGNVSIETKWIELPTRTQIRLQGLAEMRLAAYRSRWAADALANKLAILLRCPTPVMISAIDNFYQTKFQSLVPKFRLRDVKNSSLVNLLVRNYLGVFAAARATLTYPDGILPDRDWDGDSLFDSIRLPDRKTYEDIKFFNKAVVADALKIDESLLSDLERQLKQNILFAARSNAEGSRGDGYGNDYMEQACDIAYLNDDILSGYERDHRRPSMFPTDEDMLREANALYLSNIPLKWLDVGTRASALSFCKTAEERIRKNIGDPRTNAAAKGIILLQKWWVERVIGLPVQKCSVYSPKDRVRIWDAFSADLQFNVDRTSSMENYQALLENYKAERTKHYRETAHNALRQVFPKDSLLTARQYTQVTAAIDKRTDFGVFLRGVSEDLDTAQNTINGPAARLWASAISANVKYIGGDYPAGQSASSNDADELYGMFEEVKAWLARRYRGLPVDIESLLPRISLEVDTRNTAFTERHIAKIHIGVGTRRSKAEYYGWLLHELRHAVAHARYQTTPDPSHVKKDEGLAIEGSGVAVEDLLLFPLLEETLKNDTALALYTLDYGVRDARLAGTTDATLQKYLRPGCAGSNLDTIDFTKSIARDYGLLGEKADTVVERAHAGTQYLQYIWAGLYMLNEIAFLQTELNHRVDPFTLFACELNTPRRDKPYVDALKTCVGIK
jgi:hypothetical protein